MIGKNSPQLYEFCRSVIWVDNPCRESVMQALNCSERHIERCVDQIKELNIGFTRLDGEYRLSLSLQKTEELLDKALGNRPYPIPSKLSDEEQQDVLEVYHQVLHSQEHWPKGYFGNLTGRERLQVIIPYTVDKVIQKSLRDIQRGDIIEAGLEFPMRIKNNSHYRLLRVAYTWLYEWEVGRTEKYWSGLVGKKRARRAIVDLYNEFLGYELGEVGPEEISADFEKHDLGDLLNSRHLGFKGDPVAALKWADPENYDEEV